MCVCGGGDIEEKNVDATVSVYCSETKTTNTGRNQNNKQEEQGNTAGWNKDTIANSGIAGRVSACGWAVGESHASVHANANVDSHPSAVNRDKGGVTVQEDVATHGGDLAKVDSGEIVEAENEVTTYAANLAKVGGG